MYPSRSFHVHDLPSGDYALECETWFINLAGEKDWRADRLSSHPTLEEAEAEMMHQLSRELFRANRQAIHPTQQERA